MKGLITLKKVQTSQGTVGTKIIVRNGLSSNLFQEDFGGEKAGGIETMAVMIRKEDESGNRETLTVND